MAKLAATVHVKDPRTHQMVQLDAGTEPEPELAALVTNPDAWEGGKVPATAKKTADTTSTSTDDGDDGGDKPAARKTAARKPARGRNAADEGTSGD
ncbi:hypothetical protein [Streptomyces leeuwenhoekii]|uniref:Sle1_124 protein n=1 Tax=Streptomyces leeuwenhoekii TaxID=1437453 RepID=A0A0F7VR80_STRLW|nr:hypothetical protein [Streptomyces leeuwenhoekii]CQR59291.1 sle1_124 [Streptomyces leeuwenhoekii]